MKKVHKKLAALLAGFLCLAGVGATWASYSNIITIKNPFSTSKSSAVLVENFNPSSTFLPGETVDKQPYFKNTGDMDLVLRVKVTEGWKDKDGHSLTGTEAPSTEAVKKLWTESWQGTGSDWISFKGTDGETWYYYRHILKRTGDPDGADKTPNILSGVKLSEEVSNDSHETDYSGLSYYLDFEAEAVPADKVSVAGWKPEMPGNITGLDWNDLLN